MINSTIMSILVMSFIFGMILAGIIASKLLANAARCAGKDKLKIKSDSFKRTMSHAKDLGVAHEIEDEFGNKEWHYFTPSEISNNFLNPTCITCKQPLVVEKQHDANWQPTAKVTKAAAKLKSKKVKKKQNKKNKKSKDTWPVYFTFDEIKNMRLAQKRSTDLTEKEPEKPEMPIRSMENTLFPNRKSGERAPKNTK